MCGIVVGGRPGHEMEVLYDVVVSQSGAWQERHGLVRAKQAGIEWSDRQHRTALARGARSAGACSIWLQLLTLRQCWGDCASELSPSG